MAGDNGLANKLLRPRTTRMRGRLTPAAERPMPAAQQGDNFMKDRAARAQRSQTRAARRLDFTRTQLTLLSRAARRSDGAVELPPKLRGAAVQKVSEKLLKCGLVTRRAGKRGNGRGRGDALSEFRITERGCLAIGMEPAIIGGVSVVGSAPRQSRDSDQGNATDAGGASKKERLIALLRRPRGVSVAELMSESGWRAHSVRGFLAGTVRKKLRLAIATSVEDSVRIYRIGTNPGTLAGGAGQAQ
jgi:hypothetical protein